MNTIVIDFGNTRLKAGVFVENHLQEIVYLPDAPSLFEWVLQARFSSAIVMATQHLSEDFLPNLRKILPTLHFSSETPLPIGKLYDTPQTLGADRLATAVGAWHLFPQTNCLIIDAGTCITLDFLSAEGNFEGGNITLGVAMRFKALHQFTAKLPLVAIAETLPTLIGKNTKQAIYNGVINGTLAEIETTIAHYSNLFPNLKVLLCGGDSDFLGSLLKYPIFALPNLGLVGLHQVLLYNRASIFI